MEGMVRAGFNDIQSLIKRIPMDSSFFRDGVKVGMVSAVTAVVEGKWMDCDSALKATLFYSAGRCTKRASEESGISHLTRAVVSVASGVLGCYATISFMNMINLPTILTPNNYKL